MGERHCSLSCDVHSTFAAAFPSDPNIPPPTSPPNDLRNSGTISGAVSALTAVDPMLTRLPTPGLASSDPAPPIDTGPLPPPCGNNRGARMSLRDSTSPSLLLPSPFAACLGTGGPGAVAAREWHVQQQALLHAGHLRSPVEVEHLPKQDATLHAHRG
ncbi:MAG: hypothetical protein WDW36_000079 [Sanguina aurantia]